ncbi:hypothetical protein TcWFU_006457 [Taenia crassiceps]|uniref:Uncharacterized protein n=1 Tax=Taenia crassiceps TaxID=6207 RepID=A0ABR4Q6H5_9CEST
MGFRPTAPYFHHSVMPSTATLACLPMSLNLILTPKVAYCWLTESTEMCRFFSNLPRHTTTMVLSTLSPSHTSSRQDSAQITTSGCWATRQTCVHGLLHSPFASTNVRIAGPTLASQ